MRGGVACVWRHWSYQTCPRIYLIGVKTGVHGFDSRTPHKPVVSKSYEANIWIIMYDHLTEVGGQRDGCQQLSQRKGVFFLLNKKEAWNGLIQVNDDEERKGWRAGRVNGCCSKGRIQDLSQGGARFVRHKKCRSRNKREKRCNRKICLTWRTPKGPKLMTKDKEIRFLTNPTL